MATRLQGKGQRAVRPAPRACAPVPVTPTTVTTTNNDRNASSVALPVPRASGHATLAATPGPREVGTGARGALCTGKHNGNGKEDPSARARENDNGSHPRSSGPVPNCRCSISWVSIPESILTGWREDPLVQCSFCKRIQPERVFKYLNRNTLAGRAEDPDGIGPELMATLRQQRDAGYHYKYCDCSACSEDPCL